MALNNDDGSCPVSAILDKPIRAGTMVRLMGARVKDEHGTLEVHPVYSMDILQNFHLPRPANINLTGVWWASDQATYYVRQVGNAVWWFGMSRDRGRSFANVFRGDLTGIRGESRFRANGPT